MSIKNMLRAERICDKFKIYVTGTKQMLSGKKLSYAC